MFVELVDSKGAILSTSVKGFRGLKGGSTVTIQGTVKRDKKKLRILATGFYVES